jgi:hypothetical protein
METGEYETASEDSRAALILTQSWCPQWQAMKAYLREAENRLPGLTILYIEYDLVPWFEEFMAFKEETFDNREIPYVRYYNEGKCTSWSNYTSLEGFLHRLGSVA